MSHQDQGRLASSESHAQALQKAIGWLIDDVDFRSVKFRDDCTWTPRSLCAAALLWALGDEQNLTDRFVTARKITARLFPRQPQPAGSYQAFVKLLRKWTAPMLLALMLCFRERMQHGQAGAFLTAGYAVFAVDGSRVELPRSESNQREYCCRQNQPASGHNAKQKHNRKHKKSRRRSPRGQSAGKKLDNPNVWLTMMWQVGTGLPWDWRSGPSDSSEREHLLEMIGALPHEALVAADAGFVGYVYWSTLLNTGRHFVIRVGANVSLLKKLGYARESGQTVYLWPDKAAARQQPPLVLRLVVVQGGRHPLFLVTDLPASRLSDKQVRDIYKARWGVEVFYRSFKQTFQRRKLRSQAAANVPAELNWSLAALWAVCLLGTHHHHSRGRPSQRLSVTGVLKAIRTPIRGYQSRPEHGEDLWTLLDQALIDDYQRTDKASRGYPTRRKKEPPAGQPKLTTATKSQRTQAQQLKLQGAPASTTIG